MNFILEFASFNNQTLSLPRGIVLTNSERIELGNIIGNIISDIYGDKVKTNMVFQMDGKTINSEYLRKARNNRTLLKKLVFDPDGDIKSKINNKESLFNFIKENGKDLFHPTGKYFNLVYRLLENTSKKGSSFEDKAFTFFKNALKQKRGVDIVITNPTTEQDIAGIDGIFMYNNKQFTIQVKPLSYMESYKKDPSKYIVFCDGVLKNLKTDYLIASNDKENHIFKSSGITAHGSYFLIPKVNLVS